MTSEIRTLKLRWIVVSIAILAAVALAAVPVPASQPIAQQENAACTVCHDKPGSKLMTDRGKYYEARGTLEGYDQVVEVFGECTTCHSKKPGSTKLTKTGRHFLKVVHDMEGLEKWMQTTHPTGPFDESAFLESLAGEGQATEPAGDK